VQVLTYDKGADRWTVSFDAAEKVVGQTTLRARALGSSTTSHDANPETLLPQDHRLEIIQAKPVHLADGGPADLLVYGLDSYGNHPIGILGVIDLHTGSGSPAVAYVDNEQNMAPPAIVQHGRSEAVQVNAQWFTDEDPRCCPVRDYVQLIGRDTGGVKVLDDDRPWLGVWVAKPDGAGYPVVITTDAGSPASAFFHPGDRITSVDGIPQSRPTMS
jgi:hypothetical protein